MKGGRSTVDDRFATWRRLHVRLAELDGGVCGREFDRWRWRCRMAGSPACVAPLLSGQTKSGTDAWPDFGPTIGAGNGPQCDEWIDMGTCPVHAAALHAHLDHHFVDTLGTAAADRVKRRLEDRVLHLSQAFGEVRYSSIPRRRRRTRIEGRVGRQVRQGGQNLAGTVRSMLERMRLLVQPCRERGCSDTEARLGGRGEMLDGVW